MTPEATLYSQILSEICRQTRKGNVPRFVLQRGELVGLSRGLSIEAGGLVFQIKMNGDQLVALLIEQNIGVHRLPYELIELGENEF